jgi:hypothetical protein
VTGGRVTLVLAGLTLLALAASAPGALLDAWERGGFYVFSPEFLQDIPRRLAGPGRFRFVLQPLVASLIGVRAGLADARAGRSPYLWSLVFARGERRELMRAGCASVVNLLLMGILLDCVFQWVILGASHPGAALVVGPTLIVAPYSLSRALTARLAGASGAPALGAGAPGGGGA